ncbi:hypothetical protein [Thermus filiformis]|uniref:Lipoprotein n=1 Tax=Thermus filiformis TaxID=276 RepID=A0A0A2WNN3_THEFI|nr:hypothetical protein [Thermus filiformis]KGQ21776.2 hypothetical protein THFILI_09395 [Thermus filiformis]
MRRTLLATLVLGLLSACSFTVTVPLPDQEIPLNAPNTAGKVVYPKAGLSFERPPVQVQKVLLGGEAELSPFAPVSLDLYVRLEGNFEVAGCTPLGDLYYVCDVGQKDTYLGRIDLMAASSAPFTLGQQGGEALAQGVNNGRFWLGAKVGGVGSVGATLRLRNLKATATAGL